MQLYFVRHAQSTNNARWESGEFTDNPRVSDPPLTVKGFMQSQLVAEELSKNNPDVKTHFLDQQNRREYGITHVYCSLMERALQTGSIIAQHLGVPITAIADCHEVGGIYLERLVGNEPVISMEHGITAQYLQSTYPFVRLEKPIGDKGWWVGGKEDRDQVAIRANRVIDFIRHRHGDTHDRVVIITHGGFFNYLFRALCRCETQLAPDHRFPYRFMYNNCGISRFDMPDEMAQFIYHNKTDFLPDDLIT
jgi:2,3-bisphosphoglycerate-dependent phosphoglycerate mutase